RFEIVLKDDLDIVLLRYVMGFRRWTRSSFGEVTCHLEPVAGVFPLFNEPVYPCPVLFVTAELAGQGIEPEFHHGVDDRGGIVPPDESFDILAELERLPLLDAEKVLLVLDNQLRDIRFKKGYVFLYPHFFSKEKL